MSGSPLEQENHLAHYGVPGMKWGKRKAAESRARNDSIREARSRQDDRKSELKQLTRERLSANTKQGKAFLDSKIVDKKFELKNHDDAQIAAQRTTGEKWLKAGTTAATIGLSLAGLNAIANATQSQIRIDNPYSNIDTVITDKPGENYNVLDRDE